MQLHSRTLLGVPRAPSRTRLSFVFERYDRALVGLTSSYILTSECSNMIEITSDGSRIGVGDCTIVWQQNETWGPTECGFVFDIDPTVELSTWFSREWSISGMGAALGREVFLAAENKPSVGIVLHQYNRAKLTILNRTDEIYPLLAVAPADLDALRSQHGVLNGAMLQDNRDSLCGIIVGMTPDNILLVAPIVDILEKYHLSLLSTSSLRFWNEEAAKRRAREKILILKEADDDWPPPLRNSALDILGHAQ